MNTNYDPRKIIINETVPLDTHRYRFIIYEEEPTDPELAYKEPTWFLRVY